MKTKLLLLSLLLTSSMVLSQVMANQVDDFDGTLANWTIGNAGVAATQISNPSDGGPNGAGDAYFSYVTTGSNNGPGSKMLIFNRNAQWSGNFTAQGIVAIKMDVKATDGDLALRFGVSDQDSNAAGTQIVTTTPVVVTAGSGWQSVTIPISASDFTSLGGALTNAQVLASVVEMRIFSNTNVDWVGQNGLRRMDLDNINASTTLSTQDLNTQNGFEISPNPATSKLNIKLSQTFDNANVTVYDVLGKKVYSKSLSAMTSSIDVSKWNTGVYLVRISSDKQTITKRFVKQ
ncbi:MAG: T9SS type A sorting domain-containing protein [Psychroserpens sp.]|uniref:T9SS type A sorting domain-containing protein n=1 Tax=Psychroserpens sp. TaxID=2020870 RepID=UPI0030035B8A